MPFRLIRTKCNDKRNLMLRKVLELSTDVLHKTGSDVSRSLTPASKTNYDQRDVLLCKTRLCLKWFNNRQAQALVHCRQNFFHHKTPSIDSSIITTLETDAVEEFVNTCRQLLADPQGTSFLCRIVTGDEMLIREISGFKSSEPVVTQEHIEQNVTKFPQTLNCQSETIMCLGEF